MRKLLIIAVILFYSTGAFAGGPFFVNYDGSGTPILWENNTIKWVVDGGPLNNVVSNAEAVAWIKELLAIWQNAELEKGDGSLAMVANITFEYQGTLGDNIDERNYLSSIDMDEARAVFIFDATGGIIDRELGDGARRYVVGFASPLSDGSDYFAGGVVVLNGLFVDGDKKGSSEVSVNEFKSAALHEIGHLLNLDHTQANIEVADRLSEGDVSLSDELPTMYPVLWTEDQLSLHAEDAIAIAEQYPSTDYNSEFCKIKGELKGPGGKPFQGGDVVARAEDPFYEYSDVRSFVSGVMYPAGTENGEYVLGGIVPGRKYAIGYRELDSSFTGGSSIAPYDPPKTGVGSGVITDARLECQNASLSSEPFSSSSSDSDPDSDTANAGAAPGGGCSLIR